MGLAVVRVATRNIEGSSVLLSGGVEVVIMGELLGIGPAGDGILIEHNVVGEASVIHPGDGVALGDGDGCGVEDQSTCRKAVQKQEVFREIVWQSGPRWDIIEVVPPTETSCAILQIIASLYVVTNFFRSRRTHRCRHQA